MATNNGSRPGDNVLHLGTGAAQGSDPVLDKIERYWTQVRANRLVPSRCEIDPRGLDGTLANAFILERIAAGLARFRISGSHLCDLSGLELRQMPVSILFRPTSRDVLSEALASVFDDPAILRLRLTSAAGFGRDRLEGDMILLPLRSDLGDIDRVLGGLSLTGRIGRTPRRFDILSQSRQSLTGYGGPKHLCAGATDVAHLGLPDRSPSARRTSERPYLRLIVENES